MAAGLTAVVGLVVAVLGGSGVVEGGAATAVLVGLALFVSGAVLVVQQAGNGVRVETAVTGLRLTGIEFDAKTLRVVAEANGTVKVAVTQLPKM